MNNKNQSHIFKRLAYLKQISDDLKKALQNKEKQNSHRIIKDIAESALKLSDNRIPQAQAKYEMKNSKLLSVPSNGIENNEAHARKGSTVMSDFAGFRLSENEEDSLPYFNSMALQFTGLLRKNNEPPSTNQNSPINQFKQLEKYPILQAKTSAFTSTVEEEESIEKLKQENQMLESVASKLSDQVISLKEEEDKNSQEMWKVNFPFLQFNGETVSCFITRLDIKEKDYDKIDYESFVLTLQYTKLLLKKPQKKKMTEKITTKSNLQNNMKNGEKIFELSQLKEVHYIDDQIVLLYFTCTVLNIEEPVNIFIKFTNQDQLIAFDMTLFVNHKMTTSGDIWNLAGINANDKDKKSQKSQLGNSFASNRSDDAKIDQKDLVKHLIDARENYKEAKRLVNSKIAERRQQRSKGASNESFSTDRKFSKQEDMLGNILGNSSGKNNILTSIISQDQSQQIKDFNVFIEPIRDSQNDKQSRANTSRFNVENNRFANGYQMNIGESFSGLPIDQGKIPEKQNQKKIVKNPSIEKINLSTSSHKEEDKEKDLLRVSEKNSSFVKEKMSEKKSEEDQYFNMLQKLKKGQYFTKYSKDGYKPHHKKVYISQNEQYLVWQDIEDTQNKKQISITQIKSIKAQAVGEGILKHVKQVNNSNFCLIEYFPEKENKPKAIELGCSNAQLIKSFTSYLQQFMNRKKQNRNLKYQ